MTENRVDFEFAEGQEQAAHDHVDGLAAGLPLVVLTDAEKKRLPKFGDKALPFAELAAEAVQQDNSFLRRDFDTEAFLRDVRLYKKLEALNLKLLALMGKFQDTMDVLGSEVYSAYLDVYSQAKKSPNKKDLADRLGEFFIRRPHPPSASPGPS